MPAGFNVRAGIRRESTLYSLVWPSVSPVLIESLLPLLSESVGIRQEHAGIANNHAFASFPKTLSRLSSGDVSVQAQYRGIDFFLATALGFQDPNLPELLDTGVYRHLFEVDNVLAAQVWLAGEGWIAGNDLLAGQHKLRRFTYVVDKETTVWETHSAMFASLGFQASAAGCAFQATLVGYDLTFFSVIGNDLTTLVKPSGQVLYGDGMLYLGSEAPLISSNALHDLVGISLNLDNSFEVINTKDTGLYIAEPKRSGPVVVSGTFALPFYTAASLQLQDWSSLGTPLYGLLEFVGEPITEDYSYTLRFWFPNIKITALSSGVSGPEQVQQNYSFVASAGDTPDGFPENVKNGPMMIEIINDNGDHVLLD